MFILTFILTFIIQYNDQHDDDHHHHHHHHHQSPATSHHHQYHHHHQSPITNTMSFITNTTTTRLVLRSLQRKMPSKRSQGWTLITPHINHSDHTTYQPFWSHHISTILIIPHIIPHTSKRSQHISTTKWQWSLWWFVLIISIIKWQRWNKTKWFEFFWRLGYDGVEVPFKFTLLFGKERWVSIHHHFCRNIQLNA